MLPKHWPEVCTTLILVMGSIIGLFPLRYGVFLMITFELYPIYQLEKNSGYCVMEFADTFVHFYRDRNKTIGFIAL